MKNLINKFFIMSLLIVSTTCQAGILDKLCLMLEGIPLPFCKYSNQKVCHSGSRERCVYGEPSVTIKRNSTGSRTECPNNDVTLTTNCTTGTDGTHCITTSVCNSNTVDVTTCTTACTKCIGASTTRVDLGIECPHFCAAPTHCAATYDSGGKTLVLFDPTKSTDCAENACPIVPGGENLGPTKLSDCKLEPPGSSTANYFDPVNPCCFDPSSGAARPTDPSGVPMKDCTPPTP